MKPISQTVTFDVSKATYASNDREHTIELDLSQISEDDWNQYALRSIVISLQTTLRGKSDNSKNFDTSKPFVVRSPGTRVNTDPEKRMKEATKAVSILSKMTPEELIAVYKSAGVPVPEALLIKLNADTAIVA